MLGEEITLGAELPLAGEVEGVHGRMTHEERYRVLFERIYTFTDGKTCARMATWRCLSLAESILAMRNCKVMGSLVGSTTFCRLLVLT